MKTRKEKFYGSRLKEAMQLRAMKLTELAEVTDISKQSLSLYVNEINTPPVENVFKMAKALEVPYSFFIHEPLSSIRTGKTYFRSQASATKRARNAASKKMQYVAAMYEVLLNKIDFPKLNLPPVYSQNFTEFWDCTADEVADEIERLALEVRKYWEVGDGPIENLQYLLESNGIIVTGFKGEDSHIDAYGQQVNADGKTVFVVALELGSKPLGRLRFDMAHELGHILMHRWQLEDEAISRDAFNAIEKQANMFASAFLLPRKTFTRAVSAYPTSLRYYTELKKKWKVSIQAMMYRAWQLNIISANQFQYMMRQVSKNGWRLKEPGDVLGRLQDNIFQGAIDLLLDGGYMSKAEIISEFAKAGIIFNHEDLENLMCLKSGTLAPEAREIKFPVLQVKKGC